MRHSRSRARERQGKASTLKGELHGTAGHKGPPDSRKTAPLIQSKRLKSKGFLENLCHVFDKEREGKGEEVQSFA